MTMFDAKEKAAENKFAHDEEINFKVHARRNKLFGQWVAQKLNLGAEEASSFATEFVIADWGMHGDDTLLDHVREELGKHGIALSDHDLRAGLHHTQQEARTQITVG